MMRLGIKNLGSEPLRLAHSLKEWSMVLTPDVNIDVGNQPGLVWVLGNKPRWYETVIEGFWSFCDWVCSFFRDNTLDDGEPNYVFVQIFNKGQKSIEVCGDKIVSTLLPASNRAYAARHWIELREMVNDPFYDISRLDDHGHW